jgi:hypothetical protein
MNAALMKFKRIVAQVREETGLSFRSHGLSDLLRDAGDNPTHTQLAALAAHYFCIENGRWNGSNPGLMVVLEFIAETCTSLGDSGDASESLLRLIRTNPSYRQLHDWASGYFRP